ncbi:Alpha/Beta hydrolase protein [Thelonectria olida]|uniref:Alpha/Beta hydrolase protein n=1 Tax=Thelonectria olida TaxID=1576542 RepID=A0A9P8W7D4_9HYPO|nr:Alpha/Beta hydrolase protein [Thelonectria olida]
MAQIGFFGYLRLKLIVTLLRLVKRWRIPPPTVTLPSGIERKAVRIPSRDPGRFIDGWLYSSAANSASSTEKKPILVNWHGSGFIFPSLGEDHAWCSRVASDTGYFILDADYRKGPETPFPAAVHDVEDTLRWVESQSQQFDIDRVAVSGFSAGGNLALVASSVLKENYPAVKIRALVAIYPGIDLAMTPEAKTVPNPIRPIPAKIARIFNDCYTPDESTRTDPRVSPNYADPALFPDNVVLFTCSGDTLAPEGNELAAKLQNGTRRVVNQTLEGVAHGFDKRCEEGTYESEQREVAYATSIKELKGALEL